MSRAVTVAASLLALLPALAVGQAEQLRIMPGDRLLIVSPQLAWLCVTRTVQDDGRITLPEIGTLAVATQTSKEVKASLDVLLASSGHLDIEVRTLSSSDGMIRVSGAVNHSLEIRSRKGIELVDLLKLADPTETGDADHVSVSKADGTFLIVASSDRLRLKGGDRVFVPVLSGSADIDVIGGVLNPSPVRYRKGITLSELLTAAGGLAPRGDGTKIVLVRHGEPIPLRLPEDSAFPVFPGETIQVAVRTDRRNVVVTGAVSRPGLIEYSPGMTVTQALAAAGGVLPNGDGFVTLASGIGKRKKAVRLSLVFIQAVRIPDPVLQPDDVLDVGRKPGGKG